MSIVQQVLSDAPGTRPQPAPGLREPKAFRTDIQALRALAVMLVVLNHLWPEQLTGGYVGVDVFFVVSGFLITSHLLRELLATGRVRLASFYARRIRRLLPAAFLVLAASAGAALLWLPYSHWTDTAHELLASTFYVENWALAAKSVDYSASTSSATIAQHYWSLSVEEQFYLTWPLIVAGLFWIAVRRKKSPGRTVLAGLAVLTGLGFVVSVVTTELSSSQAYFVTPVRAWEFGMGSLVALALGRVKPAPVAARIIGVLGFLMIGSAAVLFTAETPFPGWLSALPVMGTAMVVLAGSDGRRPAFHNLVSATPVQYVGNISYSLYLWHWPLIVLTPFAIGQELSLWHNVLLLAAAFLLAAATKAVVEDRGQSSRFLRAGNGRTFAAMGIGMALLTSLAVVQIQASDQQNALGEQAAAAAALRPCHGPAAMLPKSDCGGKFGPVVAPGSHNAKKYWTMPAECGEARDELRAGDDKTHHVCDFSGGTADPEVVWLVGDSHAQQWLAAVFAAAERKHWIVKTALLGGCPVADVPFVGYDGHTESAAANRCMDWSGRVTDAVAADRPAAVLTSMFARNQTVDDGSGRPQAVQFASGLHSTWQRWTASGTKVFVLADPPLNKEVRETDCSSVHAAAPVKCAVSRSVAQPADPLVLAAQGTYDKNVRLVDLTDYFCDADKCYTVIGGVSVYYDANHLNREYSSLLGPILLDKIS